MKILGHPVHMMLLHFPAALIPLESIAYFTYFISCDAGYAATSFHVLMAGAILGWTAAIFGLIDLIAMQRQGRKGLGTALVHGGINAMVMTIFTVIGFKAFNSHPDPQPISVEWLIVRLLLNAALVFGNYLGGTLVLKHKIGVQP